MFIQNNTLYVKKFYALIFACGLVAILATIFFAKNIGILRSRASEDLYNTFNIKQITDEGSQKVMCNDGECSINSLDLDIEFDQRALEENAGL